MFPLLEVDLVIQDKEGKPVAERLAKVASRFSVKLSENKLKENLDSHLIPENCMEIRAPMLNVEIVEKGNLDRTATEKERRASSQCSEADQSRQPQPLWSTRLTRYTA